MTNLFMKRTCAGGFTFLMLFSTILVLLVPTTIAEIETRTSHNYVEQFGDVFDETVVATASDGLNVPRDLEFHPSSSRQNELWVINRATDSISIISNAGQAGQSSQNKQDAYGYHFMEEASAFAFGQDNSEFDYIFASSQESQNTYNGQSSPNNFMGPALWPSSLSHFANVNQQQGGALGSHLDMLHESPLGMGIAHDSGNAYWYNDGYYGELVFYDFVADHDTGGEDHDDGIVHRYSDINIPRSADVPGHMILDKANGILYIANPGAGNVLWVNTDDPTTTSSNIYSSNTRMETLAEYREITDVEFGVLASGLSSPSGIALHGDTLFVSQNGNGKISAYDLSTDGKSATHMQTVNTNANSIMGLEVGPDEKLWYVDASLNRVVRLNPYPDADGDGARDSLDNCPSISNPGQENHDGDSMGDVCDPDDDNDGILSDLSDADDCPFGEIGWTSTSETDHDGDGCKDDSSEDLDDDNDGVSDGIDDCSKGELGWISDSSSTDYDSDGCRDATEDFDDDDDFICDGSTAVPGCLVGWPQFDRCPTSPLSFTSTSSNDADRDGCEDSGEDTDDDDDGFSDSEDGCPNMVGTATSGENKGCPDGDGDSWADTEDDYSTDATQWRDSDGDGYGDNIDGTDGDWCPLQEGYSTIDRLGCLDFDEDGYSNPSTVWTTDDGADAFPGDDSQWNDSDLDGYGDNPAPANMADICPTDYGTSTDDRLGCFDTDDDGWSDEGDDFEYDPTQWLDSDDDGYGDNVAPATTPDDCVNIWGNSTLDRLGCVDSDGDGWSDEGDAYPNHKLLWTDVDGDNYSDQTGTNLSDDCPEIAGTSTKERLGCVDTDGDGWSDAADYYPKDAERHIKSKLPMIILISVLIAGLIGVSTLMVVRRKSDDSPEALGQLMTAPPPPMGAFQAPPPPGLAPSPEQAFDTSPPSSTEAFQAPPSPMVTASPPMPAFETPPLSMVSAPPPVMQPPPPLAPVAEPVQKGPPPIPAEGLPTGWTQEQWNYYGQEWLDNNS